MGTNLGRGTNLALLLCGAATHLSPLHGEPPDGEVHKLEEEPQPVEAQVQRRRSSRDVLPERQVRPAKTNGRGRA